MEPRGLDVSGFFIKIKKNNPSLAMTSASPVNHHGGDGTGTVTSSRVLSAVLSPSVCHAESFQVLGAVLSLSRCWAEASEVLCSVLPGAGCCAESFWVLCSVSRCSTEASEVLC